MSNLHIPETTLISICWGKKYFELTLKAMVASLCTTSFDKAAIVTDTSKIELNKYNKILQEFSISIENEPIDIIEGEDNDDTRTSFSKLFIRLLNKYCDTLYSLNIQYDSCIINPDRWNTAFFDYDYVAAPWPIEIITASDMAYNKVDIIQNNVGNGGFSLRSKKYINASCEMEVLHKNEDLNLCVFNYQKMIERGINFAPQDVGLEFAVEHPIIGSKIFDRKFLMTYNSFGFHGEFNRAGMTYIDQKTKGIL